MTEAEIFTRAVQLSGEQRSEFIRVACDDDETRVQRLLELLAANRRHDALLDEFDLGETDTETSGRPIEPEVPREIGDFTIGRLLGRGGMGIVYEAKQRSLNRTVALKLLSSGLGLSSRAILRFRREAEAAGKLHHTNIVPVYMTGEDDGVHYYAMELIDGPSLDQVIAVIKNEQKQPAVETTRCTSSSNASSAGLTSRHDRLAAMFAEVAEALEHAHEHGVIHRDIKPSNLLLGPDDRLSINDFGLARMLEQPGMTMTGEFVGSPLYMSPEQIAAGRMTIDHRTDIYSLGASLYEMLTLRPPFQGQSRDQVLTGILHKEPPSPRSIDRRIPVDLDTIVMKSIEKDPDRRYQTASKLSEDLRAYVNRHAISARRVGPFGRSIKFIRRNPTIAALALMVCLFVAGGGLWLLEHQEQKRIELIEQQQALISEIMKLAMSGKFDQANNRLEAAGNQLTEHDRTLLEGQILMYSDEHIAARAKFEQASASAANDTAAESLLAISYFFSGDEDGYLTKLKAVSELPTSSQMDKLFKGFALHWFARDQAMKLLTEFEDESTSVHHAAQMMLAEANLVYAMGEMDRKNGLRYANNAQVRLDFVGEHWDDSPGLRFNLMNVTLLLAEIHEDLGNADNFQSCLSDAKKIADELKPKAFQDEKSALPLMNYSIITGDEDAMIELVRRRMASGWNSDGYRTHGYFEVMMPSLLYGRGDEKLARQIYDQAPPKLRNLTAYVPAFLAMDAGNADPVAIRGELEKGLSERLSKRYTGVYALLDWVALRMLGADESLLRKVAGRVHDAYHDYFIGKDRDRGVTLAKYMRRDVGITEQDVINKTCTERGIATYAYLILAADKLAEGDRPAAQRLLERSVDAGYFQYYAYKWSRAFLRRIDDPSWLWWHEPRQATTGP